MPDPKAILDSIYNTDNSPKSILDSIYGGTGSVAQTKPLNRATIEARTVANSLFPGDDNARKAYLVSKGFDPEEVGWFTDAPPGQRLRELGADVAETMIPAAVKGAGQYIGEASGAIMGAPAGAAAGASAGGIGAVPGAAIGAKLASVAGGGAGRMMAQDMIENYAGMRGLGAPGAGERAANEAALGALTSTIGIAAPNVGFAAKKALDKLSKTKLGGFVAGVPGQIRKHVLTRISKIPEDMQAFIAKLSGPSGNISGWKRVSLAAPTAYKKVADYAQSRVMPAVAKYRDMIGQRWAQQANPVINNPSNVINFSSVRDDVTDTLKDFSLRMVPEERNEAVALVKRFISPNYNPSSAAAQSGRFLQPGPTTLREAYESLNYIDRALQGKFAGTGEAVSKSSVFIGALKKVRAILKDHIHKNYKQLAGADDAYDKGMDTLNHGLENFGTVQKAINFIPKLFERSSKVDWGKRAFDAIDDAMPNDLKFAHAMRFYGTAEYLNIDKIVPSGFQYGIMPRLAGGEDLGNAVGLAQLPFLSPRSAGKAMATLESIKMPRIQLPAQVQSAVNAVMGQAPKLIQTLPEEIKPYKNTPKADAEKDLREQFGITAGNRGRVKAFMQ